MYVYFDSVIENIELIAWASICGKSLTNYEPASYY